MSFDGTIEAQKILSAIVRTGERFGTEHLISILVGEETDAIRRFGHSKLKTFGVGKRPFEDGMALAAAPDLCGRPRSGWNLPNTAAGP